MSSWSHKDLCPGAGDRKITGITHNTGLCGECGRKCKVTSLGYTRPHNLKKDSITPATLCDLLAMVDLAVPQEDVKRWTWDERNIAERWAARELLHASDNIVQRLPKPSFLCGYPAVALEMCL